MPDTRPAAYDPASRALHWTVAALFLGALGIGLLFEVIPRDARGPWMEWHRVLGLGVLAFGAVRAVRRIARGFPAPPEGQPRWQAVAAQAAHRALLAATILMPLSGVLMGLARGRALAVWDVTVLPALPETPWLASAAGTVHGALPPVLVALVALHVGAALKHHLIDRDATLLRMTTGRGA